jgi:hypothetical protein
MLVEITGVAAPRTLRMLMVLVRDANSEDTLIYLGSYSEFSVAM